jgi:hypothetical protein
VTLVARLSSTDVDRKMAELRSAVEGVTSNLVELDADVTRRLLESSADLTGTTAAAWADASERVTRLWQGQLALVQVLSYLDERRGERRSVPPRVLDAIGDVLEGQSVELPRRAGEGRRALTEGTQATERRAIDDVLAEMSADYDAVTGLIASVAGVWGETSARIEALNVALADVERTGGKLGVGLPNELADIRWALAEVATTARRDPLSVDPDTVESAAVRVERVRVTVDNAARDRQAASAEWAAFDAALARGAGAIEDCRRALDLEEEKVVVAPSARASLEDCVRVLEGLRAESEMARLRQTHADARAAAGAGVARDLRLRVDAVLDTLAALTGAATSGRQRRDELRGLLDAYRAKAQAVGQAEDVELDELYRRLRDELYTAPCDVENAETLLAQYRRAIGGREVGGT